MLQSGQTTGGNFSKPPAFIYLGNIRDPARLEIWPFRVRLDWQSCHDLHPETSRHNREVFA
jgi:hypothetical protein